jgi:hypothetical protein
MTPTPASAFTDELAERVRDFTTVAAQQDQVKAAVEANHDDNHWWPAYVSDWRVRMAAAGWSSRISYRMVHTYAAVVKAADTLGWYDLVALSDDQLTAVVRPLGLIGTRVGYLRSLEEFVSSGVDVHAPDIDQLIEAFARQVSGASYKIAQCAVLYARGYHCGVIPVDSGMVTKLAPCLGIALDTGPKAHEQMRLLLQQCATTHADNYRDLIDTYGYQATVPDDAVPTWWLHLVLIYFKRLFLNRPTSPRLCTRRPVCAQVLDCDHTPRLVPGLGYLKGSP